MRQPLQINFIVRRRFAHLADQLREDFKDHPNVRIIVDQRYGERRIRQQQIPVEWRLGDRRAPEEMISVVIGTLAQWIKPPEGLP